MGGWVCKWKRETDGHRRLVGGRGSYCSVIVDVTGSNINPIFSAPPRPACQIVRALEHLHSKLSVIHRGQCPTLTVRARPTVYSHTWFRSVL